ncbi:MAG: metallophosphoesterase family protein, partial [Clostridium fessum]
MSICLSGKNWKSKKQWIKERKRRCACVKLFHLSDLHIGKMLNGYSLRESQKNAFLQILKYAEEEKPDAILICGDI